MQAGSAAARAALLGNNAMRVYALLGRRLAAPISRDSTVAMSVMVLGDVTNTPYRPLKPAERELLERLLEPKFPGRDELHAQLDALLARELDDEGCLEFECRSGPRANVKWPAPAHGEGRDTDGLPLYVELHVVDGFMRSLVMWKIGPDPPTGLPSAQGLSVFAPYSEEAGVWNVSERFR